MSYWQKINERSAVQKTTPKEIVKEVLTYPFVEAKDRKVSKSTCERFGIRAALSEKDGKTVECRKLLALMGLGVKKGHEVTFTFDGADEDAAYEAVSKFMQENL